MKTFDVAICGYGPVGAIFSVLLAKYGYQVLIIEKNKGPSPTARAINTDGEQLRVFDKLNIAEEIVANSNQIENVHFSDANLKPLQSIHLEPGETEMGWPNQVLFYQPELEGFIRRQVNLHKNITVMESSTLINFDNKKKGVELYVENSGKRINIFSKLLVGCDGASSFVRKQLNIELEDFGYNQSWLVCDAHLTQEISLQNALIQVCDPKRPCTFLYGRRGHLRFEFRVMPEDSLEDFKNDDYIWNLLSPWINRDNAVLERAAVYKFHACIAESWRDKNVLIAGDAAHQMPPFMGAGMGAGIRDVANLAWKIHLFFQDKASHTILNTYMHERFNHAKWTIAQTISIGEIIEGFCAAAEGKEYNPKSRGYAAQFPHLAEGIYRNSNNGINGYPIPQPSIQHHQTTVKLDKVIESSFTLIFQSSEFSLTQKAQAIVDLLNIKFLELSKEDDPEKRLNKIFDNYEYILVRPDLYVYGATSSNNLSDMIESLEDKFSLKIKP